jgi:chemotaxis receptor (MCP) glutamine deamidase CheD
LSSRFSLNSSAKLAGMSVIALPTVSSYTYRHHEPARYTKLILETANPGLDL